MKESRTEDSGTKGNKSFKKKVRHCSAFATAVCISCSCNAMQ